jgi:hypothetical protein
MKFIYYPTLFKFAFILAVSTFLIGTIVPLSPSQQTLYSTQYNEIVNRLAGAHFWDIVWLIFTNNVYSFIGDITPVTLLHSLFYTGQILQAAVNSGLIPLQYPPVVLGVFLFVFAHALLEFFVYAIIIYAAIIQYILIARIIKRVVTKKPNPKIQQDGKQLLILCPMVLVLFLAAFLEALTWFGTVGLILDDTLLYLAIFWGITLFRKALKK